ncbi:hypothetical protein Nepgr_010321 [Nepenthes gracilis]|uniref:Uncharacterized protein n=1 Tax=Nepenthes gracilis TaxID=150966 RepID=A0AAD3SCX9_NEPGR|nr:hypothetical protein Nepgr_010321 [Nepenthes gracilis]
MRATSRCGLRAMLLDEALILELNSPAEAICKRRQYCCLLTEARRQLSTGFWCSEVSQVLEDCALDPAGDNYCLHISFSNALCWCD